MNELQKEAAAIKPFLTSARRRLHGFAECGFDLPKTTEFVKNALQNMGYAPKEYGKGAIVCELVSQKNAGSFVLLRADMDALTLPEETRLPFRAENGNMHACGHDMHTAMLLGAAAILKKHENTLPVSVRFAFECAEETLSGAEELRENGVLTGVGAAMMLHVVTAVPFPTGTLLLPPPGISAPAACFFEITVTGKSAHVGEAEKGISALDVALNLYRNMQDAKKKMGEGFFLSVGKWLAGDAPNILPRRAVIEGSFRAKETEKIEAFRSQLLALCASLDGGATARVRFLGSCPPLENNAECLALLSRALPRYGLSLVETHTNDGHAAEDFATLAKECPSVALAIAAGEKERGYEHPLHHPQVLFDEDALPIGAAAYVLGAYSLGEGFLLQTFTK